MIRVNSINPTLGNEISVAIPQPSAKEVFLQTAAAGAGIACVLGLAAGAVHGAERLYNARQAKAEAKAEAKEAEEAKEAKENEKKK